MYCGVVLFCLIVVIDLVVDLDAWLLSDSGYCFGWTLYCGFGCGFSGWC